ncbi:succinate-semialdehyde dehydrogenase (NADP(+)) [Pseudoalteromonas ruthenica]|uniref:Succinate-semialdehyde dehydrogenase (NADP(+)) n=2 Tax=Pseudoalteromonas TaxID=53246 RepID=A0A5S3Z269_9GAMM|nr:NAD-dependent succinate-semialdehyde dehydrogenase [Pseudoalteromonas ruthenica]TMP86369.1 succinate-semialdehyde dehydrogenase (NADP(+)) [Pseudoalteromonas ruthenica]
MDSAWIFQHSFIDGQWLKGEGEFAVTNPADGSEIVRASRVSPSQVEQAITSAQRAFKGLKTTTAEQRSEVLYRWYELIMKHQHSLAELMTLEQGKPLAESQGEVAYGAGFVKWFAEQAKRSYGEIIPASQPEHRISVIKQGVGVVAGITPWNFPIAMITRKVAPAYAAGCSFVLKPSEHTPLCALALAHLAHQAGFPRGAFNVLLSDDAKAVGEQLTASETVRKFTFTGSTQVGSQLLKQCASTIKRTSMELGGNAPLLVFASADLDKAADGIIASKFRNAGQTCVCVNRVLADERIADKLLAKLQQRVAKLKVGPGTEEGVDIGPLIYPQAKTKVNELIDSALQEGATLVGERQSLEGNFVAPVLLSNVTSEMRISREEIFGPVLTVATFKDEQQALQQANDTPYGLAAYFYSQDVAQIHRVAETLEYGMVGINEGLISNPVAPFGGVKQSGLGREGGHQGLEEYLEEKYLCLNLD